MPRVTLAELHLPPPVPPADDNGGGECGINGPHLGWCGAGFPAADYKGIIVFMEGVRDGNVIEWSTTIGAEDAFFRGDIDRPAAIMQVINFDLVGTVTATVDGTAYTLAISLADVTCNPT